MTQFFDFDNLSKFYEKNKNSIAFAYLAARLIEKEEYQEAIDLCRQGVQSHPQYAFGHYIVGMAYYHLKNYNEAKKELEFSLAYDAATPRGWEVLSTVNEILNLSDDANDSNLNSYLYDVFNEEAVNNFVIDTKEGEMPAPESSESSEPELDILDSDQELTDKDIDDLISTTTEKEDKGDDFLKTLDDIFIEKEKKATDAEPELPAEPEEMETLGESDDIDLKDIAEKKDDIVTAEEFTSAIDSFFSEYEEKGKGEGKEEKKEEQPAEPDDTFPTSDEEIPSEKVEEDIEEGFEELKDEDFDLDQETEQETSTPQFGPVFEVPEQDETTSGESVDEAPDESESELMDFSSVVSDIIEEEEKESTPETETLSEPEDLSTEEISLEEKDAEDDETPIEQEEKTSNKKSIPTPDIHELDQQVELKKESGETGADAGTKETMKFGRPPILSPTLGEIYIAQGRFEEAIDVFRQLLEKDPDSARFKRKIQDLEAILKKKGTK